METEGNAKRCDRESRKMRIADTAMRSLLHSFAGKKGKRRRSSPAVNATRGDGAALNQLTDWDSVEAAFDRGRTGGSGSGFKLCPFLVGCYTNS